MDKLREAGFTHPCKQTCSGYTQGYEDGLAKAREVPWTEEQVLKQAEKAGDDCSADIATTDDEQSCFKTGVEFGFKLGIEMAEKRIREQTPVVENGGVSSTTPLKIKLGDDASSHVCCNETRYGPKLDMSRTIQEYIAERRRIINEFVPTNVNSFEKQVLAMSAREYRKDAANEMPRVLDMLEYLLKENGGCRSIPNPYTDHRQCAKESPMRYCGVCRILVHLEKMVNK